MTEMIIAVKAHGWQKTEWLSKPTGETVRIIWVEDAIPEADAYFDLTYEEFGAAFAGVKDKPVFVSAILQPMSELVFNASRINAWNGFLGRETIEVVLNNDAAGNILQQLNWKYLQVPDIPGMIAPRTISMVINEAYFALDDDVSTKAEIDTAMKLGTNYPFGPFEWSNRIGLHNVYRLLKKLAETDERYLPAPALEQELKTIA
jgi:3-hydroxybutyryl-CoA dehydrogenase